jgi:hypothetical protein
MESKFFHGSFSPQDLADSLISHFDRGNLKVQQVGDGEKIAVQIATSEMAVSGGQTALSVNLQKVEDGVSVSMGRQAWFGVAANIGVTILTALRNPLALLHRLDDIAQDAEYIRLIDEVWKVIENTARSLGSGFEFSERVKRYVCEYCLTANPVGEPRCIACGAPLGGIQSNSCKHCGYVLLNNEVICPNCNKRQ